MGRGTRSRVERAHGGRGERHVEGRGESTGRREERGRAGTREREVGSESERERSVTSTLRESNERVPGRAARER